MACCQIPRSHPRLAPGSGASSSGGATCLQLVSNVACSKKSQAVYQQTTTTRGWELRPLAQQHGSAGARTKKKLHDRFYVALVPLEPAMDWSGEELQEEDDVDMHAVETTNNDDRPSKPNRPDVAALDRRNTAVGGSNSQHGSCRSCRSSEEELPDSGQLSPPMFSSPSVASSVAFSRSGGFSPLRQHLSRDNHDVSSRTARQDLAKRLTLLAQRLTCGDELDESSLTRQVEQMEKAVSPPSSPRSPPRRQQNIDSPRRSETGSSLGSPLSLIRSQFSDLSVESYRDRERQREREIREEEDRQTRAKLGMSVAQAKKIIAESTKLNDELSTIVSNLKARQEETEVRIDSCSSLFGIY